MKVKKRNGVFETNSSSTHSLTLRWIGERTGDNKKIDPKSSFEIWSPLAKVVWFLGIVENAEKQYQNCEEFKEYSPEYYLDIVRKEARDYLEKNENAKYFLKTVDGKWESEPNYDLTTYSYADLMCYLENASAYDELEKLEDICYKLERYQAREYVLQFKKMLIDAYCELENISREEAFKRFREEHAKDHELEYYLSNSNKFELAVKRAKNNDCEFAKQYEVAEDKQNFVKEYVLKQKQGKANECGNCFNCSKYFGCGVIGDCDCNFENYYLINNSLIKFMHSSYIGYTMGDPYDEDDAMDFLTHIAIVGYGGDHGDYTSDIIF